MIKSDLWELIANGENSGVEFTRGDVHPEQLAKEAVALANFQGGRILLGVDDDGAVTGTQRDNLERWVMDTVFARYIHPMIIPFYKEMQLNEQQRVAVVTVGQGTTKPYMVRNRGGENIYIRMGGTSRRATREQQAMLFACGDMLRAEQLPVSGSGLVDLSQERLKHYLLSIVGDEELPANDEQWNERLCALGFMTEREDGPAMCTIAGLVLFGCSPRRLLPQAGIRWMALAGEDKGHQALDDRMADGPLTPGRDHFSTGGGATIENGLLETLTDAMRPFVSVEASDIDASTQRERSWLYPVAALREAIINAVAHRDWTCCEKIEVGCYANRLEVLSPGALQTWMTVEKMIAGRRSARNPLIVGVLRDYGCVDVNGMGVRHKIIPLLREHNGTEPEFEATENYLKVVMHRGPRSLEARN